MGTLQRSRQRKHTLVRVGARYVAGRDLDGQRRTNATFLRHADRDLTDHGRASRWSHMRHAERSAVRLSLLAATVAFGWGWVSHRHATVVTLAVTLAGALAFTAWRGVVLARRATHMRKVVRPLYRTLAPLANHPPGDVATRYLNIPCDKTCSHGAINMRRRDRSKVSITLSPTWEGTLAQQKAIAGVMSRKLGGDWDAHFYMNRYPPVAEFTRSPEPPRELTFEQFRFHMDRGSSNDILLGIGTHNKPVRFSLDSDSPHFALSMSTGGGKSSLIRLIVAYLIHHGCERIDIIDPKRVSHNWAKLIPGVYIWRTMDAQMQAIREVRKRMDVRYAELDEDDSLTFPRHVLIIEEQNSWMMQAAQYWSDYRAELDSQERGKTPKRNPAIGDLGYILFQGRQGNINVISVLQRMSASAAGGGDMREQYGAKLLARYSASTWRILVGTTPVPKSSRVNGRAMFVLADEPHAVQVAFLTEAEAVAYAMEGLQRTAQAAPEASSDDDAELYSLRELADNVVPIRYGALRKARQRDPAFPRGVNRNGVLHYTQTAIAMWHANRTRGQLSTAA